ncbi:MAG TPA: aldo/keto reductase [Gemmatimonadales bacterium]|nr:aldo/keto reductase [Gemmatimonadales bacterium]
MPPVGFGGMPLSTAGRPDETEAVRVIHAALDAGVRLLDTADVYCLSDEDLGHNERLMARALREWHGPRDEVIVATKGGMTRPQGSWDRNGRPEHLRRACDRSLLALGVDRIDLYQFHAPDPRVPFAESVGMLAELQQAGKIRWVGLSNVSVDQINAARRHVEVVTVQNRLNPYFREALTEGVVEHCENLGIGFLAYSPVGGGRLNKKLPDHPVVTSIAKRHGASPHAVVLAWVLEQASNVIVIPGARTVAHALDSWTAGDLRLDPQEMRDLDAAEFDRR